MNREILPRSGLINLGLVYIIWGSTFLAIRVAVGPGGGFPPFTLVLSRLVVAGALLFVIARMQGKQLRVPIRELLVLAVTGILLWAGGNGLVVWAEQHLDAGLAALLVATVPLWTALLDSALRRQAPSVLLAVSLLLGLAGVGILSTPSLSSGSRESLLSIGAVILASFLWSVGAEVQRRHSRTASGQVRSAFQHLFGAVALLVILAAVGEPAPEPSTRGWLAWGFLVIFGSVIGFTAFTTMVNQLPSSVAMTYAYVNPLITVALGALLLGEALRFDTFLGGGLILLGVAGVFHDRRRVQRANLLVEKGVVSVGD